VVLTQQDNGKRIELSASEPLELSLAENPTTGFRWSFVDLAPSVRVADDSYNLEGEATPGAAANHRFRLEFSDAGEYEIALRLWRDWEGEASTLDRYAVTVDVTDGV
jgi:inhibitor of cysteine peptidase